MADRLYAGIGEVRALLQRAVVRGRAQRGFTNDELDGICLFGQKGLPSSRSFEADASLITRQIFCRASFPLGLAADTALDVDARLSADVVLGIVEEMKNAGSGAVFGCGGDGSPIGPEEQAKVYVVLKLLEELG